GHPGRRAGGGDHSAGRQPAGRPLLSNFQPEGAVNMTGMNGPAPTDDVWVAATRRAVLERDITDTRVVSKRVSPFRRFLRRFLKQKTGMVAAIFLILVTLMAILTPL